MTQPITGFKAFGVAMILLMTLLLGGCEDPGSSEAISSDSGSKKSQAVINVPDRKDIDHSHDYWTDRKSELRFLRAPKLRELDVPDSYGNTAIWGATGRDSYGRVYFGIAAEIVENPSAKLLRYQPSEEKFELLGLVNEKLEELGIRKEHPFPETQMKIHSKILQAGDGKLYFSSQDEHEEAGDGSHNALFGGRLFSLDPISDQWECVLDAPEGLIAVAVRGRFVVTQGYFGHVLYQFDTQTKKVRKVTLGTYKGHVSRNIFMDRRGHVYGIRARLAAVSESDGVYNVGLDRVRVTLVELNTELEQVSEWPLSDYNPTWSTDSHGITGFCEFNNGDIVFVTHSGALWHLRFTDGTPNLDRLGWIAPSGSVYCSSLFAPFGERYVSGFLSGGSGYEWAVFDLQLKRSVILKLDEESKQLLKQTQLLVYGCDTLDDRMRGYIVGWKKIERGYGPYVIQLSWD